MKNINLKVILSIVVLYSIGAAATVKAAPIQFNQVVQIVNAKPGKANTGGFAQLRLTGDDPVPVSDDETKKVAPQPQQDDRVIVETRSEIVEDEVCDCIAPPVAGSFPYAWLTLGAAPLLFLIPNSKDEEPPNETPFASVTPTTTPTPVVTPTPTPEPMTIFLFGTGLAGIGLAARRRFGKKDKTTEE